MLTCEEVAGRRQENALGSQRPAICEQQFRRVKSYRDIPQLVAAIRALANGSKLPVVVAARRVG